MDLTSSRRGFGFPRERSSSSNSSLTLNRNNATSTIHQINFGGKTIEATVTNDASTITQWVTDISSRHRGGTVIVGLDVEWKPNHSRYMNKAATLQLCTGTKCLIIQLIHLNTIPRSLNNFLSYSYTPNVTFVGVGVANDVAKLESEYGLCCRNIEDLREVAMFGGSGPRPGLKDLAWRVAGLVMEKPKYVTLSDWEARVLSEEQVKYACIDAYASYRVGHKLLVER